MRHAAVPALAGSYPPHWPNGAAQPGGGGAVVAAAAGGSGAPEAVVVAVAARPGGPCAHDGQFTAPPAVALRHTAGGAQQ